MSRKPYKCFRCRDNGFPNTRVYLAGKDEQGKTIQLEEDGTRHTHKQGQQQPQKQQQQLQPKQEYEKSVDDGISAFSMMTNLILLVEQTQKLLVSMDGKIDHLTKLVYTHQQQQQQQQQRQPPQ